MMIERAKIEAAIAAIETQCQTLGDAVVELALAPLRANLATCVESDGSFAEQQLKRVTILVSDVVGTSWIRERAIVSCKTFPITMRSRPPGQSSVPRHVPQVPGRARPDRVMVRSTPTLS